MAADGSYQLCQVPGKGVGVVATRDLPPGTRLILEKPLLILDPPTDRNTLLKTLGCDWCKVNLRAPPELVRAQIQRLVLEKSVRRMKEDQREQFMKLADKNASDIVSKTVWGIFLTNALPMGSYRVLGIYPSVARINHSCKPNAHHFFNEEDKTEEVWITEPVRTGEEITVSYIRTFCSKSFRQQLLQEKFGFLCSCSACSLTGALLQEDDHLRLKIDGLAQDFALASQDTRGEGLTQAIRLVKCTQLFCVVFIFINGRFSAVSIN